MWEYNECRYKFRSYAKTLSDLEKKLAEMDKRLADEQSLRRSLLDDKVKIGREKTRRERRDKGRQLQDRQLEMYQRRVKDLNDEIARLMAECNELADAKVRMREDEEVGPSPILGPPRL